MNAIIITAVWGIVMMFSGVFIKSKTMPKYLAIAGLLLAFVLNCSEQVSEKVLFEIDPHGMFEFSAFGYMFNNIAFICTLLFFLLNGRDIEKVGSNVSEYFALLFFILCGVSIATSFSNLLMLFISIEIMSIPLYILTGSDKRNLKSNEAALKYFLMGVFSTGIMLMGIAFIYGGNANASFSISQINFGSTGGIPVLLAIGMVLLFIAMCFKVSAAPFHFWVPDVYDGAPTVFTSFMATIVKTAAFVAFIRLFKTSFGSGSVQPQWQLLVVIVTVATLLFGNITAVFQQSVKRMLAYSSIAQAGFMLFALFAVSEQGTNRSSMAYEAVLIYSAAYCLAGIGIFAILIRMNDYTVDGFNGLAKKQPLLAVTALIFLLSLTGIPLTAGFTGKFYMLMAAMHNGHFIWLIILAVLCTAVSAYYYFRIIQAMFFKAPSETAIQVQDITFSFKLLLAITSLLIILVGLFPELLLQWLFR
ncbi:MAG: NADH-quinone oxidoreductase subunit N [Ferruginibacter sp.]